MGTERHREVVWHAGGYGRPQTLRRNFEGNPAVDRMIRMQLLLSQFHPRALFHAFRRRPIWYSTLTVLFVYAVSVFIPWQPYITKDELDSSWFLMLHWARIHRLDFGRDLIFTYGPLGFIHQGYHPDTFGLVVVGWLSYTAVFFA